MQISQKIKLAVAGLAVVLGGAMMAAPAMATVTCGDNTARPQQTVNTMAECNVPADEENKDLMSMLNVVLNVVFGVIGFIAVVMLVYGGIQYTVSSGDAGKVKKAKDTILYGIVGLIIALLAAAIVNFVLGGVFGS